MKFVVTERGLGFMLELIDGELSTVICNGVGLEIIFEEIAHRFGYTDLQEAIS